MKNKIVIIAFAVIIFALVLGYIINQQNKTQNLDVLETDSVEVPVDENGQPINDQAVDVQQDIVVDDATGEPVAETVTTLPVFTMDQVAEHNTAEDCYSAINGYVYDLTAWVSEHPGGEENILSICGKDGSNAFDGQHEDDPEAEAVLSGFEVGILG